MKKLICAILSIMFVFSFAACKKDETTNNINSTISETSSDKENVTTQNSSTAGDTTTDFNISAVQGTIKPPSVYEAPSNVISIELFKPTFNFDDIKTYEPVKPAEFKIDFDEFESIVIDNIDAADAAKLEGLTSDQINAIATKKANFQYDLVVALKAAGISAQFNEKNGEIGLDSAVLFGGDSAELSTAGKEFLNSFIKAYSSVVTKDEYKDFISKVMVEGHTAPVAGSTYESGLPLSQQRADNVKNHCISKASGLTDTQISVMTNVLVAKGMSNSEPIKDSSGKVDMAASRRVTFKFIIKI